MIADVCMFSWWWNACDASVFQNAVLLFAYYSSSGLVIIQHYYHKMFFVKEKKIDDRYVAY